MGYMRADGNPKPAHEDDQIQELGASFVKRFRSKSKVSVLTTSQTGKIFK